MRQAFPAVRPALKPAPPLRAQAQSAPYREDRPQLEQVCWWEQALVRGGAAAGGVQAGLASAWRAGPGQGVAARQTDLSAFRKAACRRPLLHRSVAKLQYPAFRDFQPLSTSPLRWRILQGNAIAVFKFRGCLAH